MNNPFSGKARSDDDALVLTFTREKKMHKDEPTLKKEISPDSSIV